ncbi:MAG: hypothetical protein ABFD16_06745 [Thermoguttaceae bacterium]|jgi:hypothetical protein
MKKWAVVVILVVVVVAGLSLAASQGMRRSGASSQATTATTQTARAKTATTSASRQTAQGTEAGIAAMDKAAEAKRYLFAFFWKEEDEQTAAMKKVFEAAMAQVSDRADAIAVQITDPAEEGIVDKFQLDRAPMPLVLALAPNGAITGGFPKKFEVQNLLDAFATPCMEQCMKALQENKLVLVCVQNETTESNDAAMQGVRDFQADSRYSEVTEVVLLNPADDKEASFLGDLKINPKTTEAITAFMAPPGMVIAEFTGETKKEDLVTTLEKASSGCCPGGQCGPGGCAPKK